MHNYNAAFRPTGDGLHEALDAKVQEIGVVTKAARLYQGAKGVIECQLYALPYLRHWPRMAVDLPNQFAQLRTFRHGVRAPQSVNRAGFFTLSTCPSRKPVVALKVAAVQCNRSALP